MNRWTKMKNIYFNENCFLDILLFERWKEKMNKREVMKVENLVRNYKMIHSDRQGEEEIKVLKDWILPSKNRNLSASWENRVVVRRRF